ncbi:hypothetical protein [Desulfonatronum sp. SC1]|uniref:InlB B-repeat-containing protein n=1 Tax=Desulfonatronum sp. SC1 TaxID=2109626 RepID=UPI000D3035B6|nr:hypothetical protein [Desulfonatronum sp. SC1]PTN33782.1 hypothetical protein C6366_13920 [Desulfonatronum sp. SC1]
MQYCFAVNRFWIVAALLAAALVLPCKAVAQDPTAPVNMGIYGGTVERISGAPMDASTTRLFLALDNPNSVFYADIPHDHGYPFIPDHVWFQVVPGLAAEQNRGLVTHISTHQATGRLYANPGLKLFNFGTDPQDQPQEVAGFFVPDLLVHGDRVFFTQSVNDPSDPSDPGAANTFSLQWQAIDPATGRGTGAVAGVKLHEQTGGSTGWHSEMAVCPVSGKLYMLLFFDGGHDLHGKLLVSKETASDMTGDPDYAEVFEVRDLPAYAADWRDGSLSRWPIRLGVGPDGRVFIAGLDGDPTTTIRVAYSDNQGQDWSLEVDTGVEQGFLGPQMAFAGYGILTDPNDYFVYLSSSRSTGRGADGTWEGADIRHAPFMDPVAPVAPDDKHVLYSSFEQLGLGYSTEALSDPIDLAMASYTHGIEAVQINDFDFTADKTIGWTASGQGLRRTADLQGEPPTWTEPMVPGVEPSFFAVAIDPNATPAGSVVFAGGTRNVYRTVNANDSDPVWSTLFNGYGAPDDMALVKRIAVKPGNSNVIFAGYATDTTDPTAINGLMASINDGTDWNPVLFDGDRFLDVRDLLFVDADLFVAAAYDAGHPDSWGVFRVDTTDPSNLVVHHELAPPTTAFHARSLAVDSSGGVYVAGVTTDWVQHGYSGSPRVYYRALGGTSWVQVDNDGLPNNAEPAQADNTLITVGVDANDVEAPLLTFGRRLYVLLEDEWDDIYEYPFQTELQVLKWDELTLGSGSGLYAQDVGVFPEEELVTLTVVKAGSGQGTVVSNPPGIHCGLTCQGSIDEGEVVGLTANPAANSSFARWGGNCSGTRNTCTLVMDDDKDVTARFVAFKVVDEDGGRVGSPVIMVNEVYAFTVQGSGTYQVRVFRNGVFLGYLALSGGQYFFSADSPGRYEIRITDGSDTVVITIMVRPESALGHLPLLLLD